LDALTKRPDMDVDCGGVLYRGNKEMESSLGRGVFLGVE
jgi:hypothetical protein